MPKPHVFTSESYLISALRDSKTKKIATDFFDERVDTIAEVVRMGVGSNTYRAFRNLPVRPSTTFRMWTESYIEKSMPPLSSMHASQDYAAYVHDATLALVRYWRTKTRSEMGYGRGAKLLNLVLKKLACLSTLSDLERRNFIFLQHIPLDSYTIMGIQKIAPDLDIPNGSTMKYIKTPDQYKKFQERIAKFAAKAKVPAIYYDILAWDMGHDAKP